MHTIHAVRNSLAAIVLAAFFISGLGCQPMPEKTTQGDTSSNKAPGKSVPPTTTAQAEQAESAEAVRDPIQESAAEAPSAAAEAPVASTTPDGAEQPSATDETQGRGRMGRGRMGRGRMGRGRGMAGHGRGGGPGRGVGGNREDMVTLHAMFDSRDKITRTIKNLPNGAETLTESTDGEIASLIQEHVPAMEGRIENDQPLPPMQFHPLFVELLKHYDKVTMRYDATDRGLKVTYTSNDPYVVMLIQEHAKLVSRFIKNGMEEIHKPYTIPKMDKDKAGKSKPSKAAVTAPKNS